MKEFPALTVSQWLPTWDEADFSEGNFRRRPPEQFLLLSMDATELKRLVGIQRRSSTAGRPRARDLGIQRAHDVERSKEIAEYVQHGFPWSSLSAPKRKTSDFQDLVKPGWLPTAVVVNILLEEDDRDGQAVKKKDLVSVDLNGATATVTVPDSGDKDWALSGLAPIEVIDGQHRLWAFDDDVEGYQIPVVAFHGLDRSWQAYLFYTINISPKRINSSLAYDLYPLLRTEDWLEKFEGHSVYRESRAQELTESLWSHPDSPWHHRINMLGERGQKTVTQASWVRSLQATIVKSWEGRRVQIGGLFGAPVGENDLVLPWSRAQQAAFLIYCWKCLEQAIERVSPAWVDSLKHENGESKVDRGLRSSDSMLNSDMGVRGFLYLMNDLCYVMAGELKLRRWEQDSDGAATSELAVSEALKALPKQPVGKFVEELAGVLAEYDWRSSKASDLTEAMRQSKARFRGGSGYRELRQELLQFVDSSGAGAVASAAAEVRKRLAL
jgi:DGQHR domain-containing protein